MFVQKLIENSILISALRKSKIAYFHTKRRLDEIYRCSLTHRLMQTLWKSARISFQYSFFNRIAQEDYTGNRAVLDNSKIVRKLLNIYKRRMYKTEYYFKTSIFKDLLMATIRAIYFLPLRIIGIILASSILTNIFFSILLNKETGFFGWMIKLALLFLGTGCLYSDAEYQSLKETSFFIRYVNNYCKIQK